VKDAGLTRFAMVGQLVVNAEMRQPESTDRRQNMLTSARNRSTGVS